MHITQILDFTINTNHSAFFYTPKIYKHGRSILFKSPVETITAKNKKDFISQLERINSLIERGLKGYGLIHYEAGYLLEERLTPLFKETEKPILTFHFFEKNQMQFLQHPLNHQ